MILLSVLVLSVAPPTIPEPIILSPTLEISPISPCLNQTIEPVFHALIDPALYFCAGTFFGSATLLSGIGWGVTQLSPSALTIGNELLISTQLLGTAAIHSFAQTFKSSPFFSFLFKKVPSSYSAWLLNQQLLSQIPASTQDDRELLEFLKRRWLAKTTGCYPFLVDWLCPSFGISYQVHPETTNSYARLPSNKFSDTYRNRIEAWKQFLPHPKQFPLILTRPTNISGYLPFCFELHQEEPLHSAIEKLTQALDADDTPLVVDVTSVLPSYTMDRKQWLDVWHSFEHQFSNYCKEKQLDLERLICIQRVEQKEIGGIRLLPFSFSSEEKTKSQYAYLLEWISQFGLTANRIELDRPVFSSSPSLQAKSFQASNIEESGHKEKWTSIFSAIDERWSCKHPQKTLMFRGALQVLKDFNAAIPAEKWEETMHSSTRASAALVCLNKIQDKLELLLENQETFSFHETATHLEQVHYDLASLFEIFSPFTLEDFLDAFQKHLSSIPQALRPLTGYGIHASAMTSLAGIFKAIEKTLGRAPRILFGENTYFECIHAGEGITQATSIEQAMEEDWKEVDLILAQFNPTVKRINFKVTEYQATEYHVEKIADMLHHALNLREGRPLSLALDCTLDYSNSQRVGQLLAEFQKEIESGILNIICYRSGLKFDLFGMDNYCGAPFFMVHNKDAKWAFFDSLLTDPVLNTDRLSINWFCAAFQHAAPYLEAYRKQIFDNTRAVLNKIPARLFSKANTRYRVVPVDTDADPTFIDIKIFGPLHTFRGELLCGAFLTVKCMEAGYPLLYRPGIGFYHPNLAVLYGQECTTVRLTLGLDPDQVNVIVRCLEKIDACNGPTL